MITRLKVDYSTEEARLNDWLPSIGPGGWCILERYTGLSFETWKPGSPLGDDPKVFAGRLFGPNAELRWTRENGAFELWKIHEAPDGPIDVSATERSYYGWAYFEAGDAKKKHVKRGLWDPRLHHTPIYPPKATALLQNDRPRFTVVEYHTELLNLVPETIGQAEQWLNAPRFIAYRLKSFDYHSGEE